MLSRFSRIPLIVAIITTSAWAQPPFVNYESPQIHPVDISPDHSTLAVCNTAAARIELFNVTTGNASPIGSVAVGYDPVSVRFRNNDEAWVVNHISDSVSIVDIPTQRVRATIATADEPCDVVFAGDPVFAFVSCSQVNRVQRFNPDDTKAAPTNIDILAEDPRALAVSPDGLTVYAAIFESGNRSTLIAGGSDNTIGISPGNDAMEDPTGPYGGVNPPPNDPDDVNMDGNLFMPPKAANGTAPKVGLIVKQDTNGAWRDDNGSDWTPWVTGAKANLSGRYQGWELIDRDVAVINTATLAVTYIEHLMNLNMAIAVNPASGDITVVGTEGTNEVRFEPIVSGRFIRVRLAMIDPAKVGPSIVDLNAEHLGLAQGGNPYEESQVAPPERNKSIGDPRGILWNATGTLGYITGMGSNNLVVINSFGERIDVGFSRALREGPTGLALDESRNRLYVLNRFHGSISVVETTNFNEISNVPFFDPTPPPIKIGRKHLYDTHKNSGLGHIACASCHIDGRMDRLAWDLGDPAGAVKPLSGTGNPPIHNLGAGIPGLAAGQTSPAFQNFHPMKGPMTTQTLQGIIGMEPHHWRGDRNGLEEFNPAFVGLQGDDPVPGPGPAGGLTPQEMQEFENFIATLHFPPNPHRNFDNSLPTDLPLPRQFANGRFALANGAPLPNGDAVRGLQLYRDQNAPLDAGNFTCVICHTLPTGAGTDSFLTLPGGIPTFLPIPPGPMGEHHLALVSVDGATNRAIKVPHLRNQFDKAGFETTLGNPSYAGFGVFHDGSIDSIARFVSEPVFEVQSDQDVADLTALVLSFSGGFNQPNPGPLPEPPGPPSADAHAAIGKQVTVESASKIDPLVEQMLAIANAGRVDVVVKGSLLGYQRGWFYQGNNQFLPDWSEESALTTAALLALAAPGSELTFTVVPINSGERLGVDRDLDGTPDFDEFLASDVTPPTATLASDTPNVVNGAIEVSLTLSEPSISFDQGDITVTNAAISDFAGGGLEFTFTLTPIANGTFTAKVGANKFTDFAGNPNTASNTLTRSNGEPAGKLKVKKPNGGEAIEAGAKFKIRWTSTGAVGDTVKIELWRNGSFVMNIKASTDNDGKQPWNVSNSVPKGGGYKVRVVSTSDIGISDMSNNAFEIVAAP
ncbi:MAG: beta-propeller fold lactonase family protein [Candidatus Hydrogenedentes bacterium]|nr:beta-propeller fold lactonase family protein [Candidatus Hydrogenedentota bacterium]